MSERDRNRENPAAEHPSAEEEEAERHLAEMIKDRFGSQPIEPSELAKVFAEFVTIEVRRLVHFEGPYPPPELVREYEHVYPGSAS